jgi:hypothetical protein
MKSSPFFARPTAWPSTGFAITSQAPQKPERFGNDLGFTAVTIAALLEYSKGSVTSTYIHALDTALIMAPEPRIQLRNISRAFWTGRNSSRRLTLWIAAPGRTRWLVSSSRLLARKIGRMTRRNA